MLLLDIQAHFSQATRQGIFVHFFQMAMAQKTVHGKTCLPDTIAEFLDRHIIHRRSLALSLLRLFVARLFERRFDKTAEERMGFVGLGEKFRVELAGDEPWMIAQFN